MKNKKIAIICSNDGYANSIRPLMVKSFLENRGHKVIIIDTAKVSNSTNTILYTYFLTNIKTKLIRILEEIYKNIPLNIKSPIYYWYLVSKFKKRANSILKSIENNKYDIIICENVFDSYLFKHIHNSKKILDLPSSLPDEIYQAKKLSKYYYKKLINFINEIYLSADHLTFHWHLYNEYIENNIYKGTNMFELNWGCSPVPESKRSRYVTQPKIIFLGYLAGDWVNLPLLSRLSQKYNIDVYGGPEPDPKWKLNYKGYAPTTEILKNYQFGIITITKDKFRKSSFSSKHLEYISYGLPVLTPEWRKDPLLNNISIYYNEKNYLKIIEKYSNRFIWQSMSNKCYNQSKKWTWKKMLRPLDDIITIKS